MGSAAFLSGNRETVDPAVFDSVVPVKRSYLNSLPHGQRCGDCGRAFNVATRMRRCRICAEALCSSCCPLQPAWRWRAVCAYCTESCVYDYHHRRGASDDNEDVSCADPGQQVVAAREGKKRGPLRFVRGLFVIPAEDGKLVVKKTLVEPA